MNPCVKIRHRSCAETDVAALDASGVPPLLARLYAARGVRADETELSLRALAPPEAMRGVPEAAALLADALERQASILIVGDFDADGATSSALARRALRDFGAERVSSLIPDRFTMGYGLTPALVEHATRFDPALLVTVDNGIGSIDGVRQARRNGWQVIVTDHHLPGEELPEADVIVDPNQPGCDFPNKALAGVGVIFYVMMRLRHELRARGWFERRGRPEPNLAALLDLVALGTVADVVPLNHQNRILVDQGLRRIRAGRCRPGIAALFEVAGRDPSRAVASDLGFAIGPRINAAGRLEDMSIGVACLLADDSSEALRHARRLDELNRRRREVEGGMVEEARRILDGLKPSGARAFGITLYEPHWHQGVVGLVASRVKSRAHAPVIAFARDGEGRLKGSGRSIPGVHLRDALDRVDRMSPGLIERFGGHAMAAGLTLKEEGYAEFARRFDAVVRDLLGGEPLGEVLEVDGELPAGVLDLETAEAIRFAGPWGQGFPEPLFEGRFEIVTQRIVGERHLKLLLRPLDAPDDAFIDAIAFQHSELLRGEQARLYYRLDVNQYRGRRGVQLIVERVDCE